MLALERKDAHLTEKAFVCVRVCVQTYGGFVASHMLAADSVHCAAAVSPITDWRYLGSVSTASRCLSYAFCAFNPSESRGYCKISQTT